MTTLIPKFDLKNGGTTPAGAINRTIYEKLSDFVSVKDFGAVGDGVADDTAAIQAAWNSSGNIYFPIGTYLVSSSLNFTNAVGGSITGAGRYGNGTTNIKGTAAIGNYPIMDFSGSNGIYLSNFAVEPNGSDTCFIGILFARVGGGSSGNHLIKNVNIYGKFSNSCIYKSSSEEDSFYEVWAETLSDGARAVSDVAIPESGVTSLYQNILSPTGGNTETSYFGGRYINQTSNPSNRAFYVKNARAVTFVNVYMFVGTGSTYAFESVDNIALSLQNCTCEGACINVIGATGTSNQQISINTCVFNSATSATLFADTGTPLIDVSLLNTVCSSYALNCHTIKNSTIDCFERFAQVLTVSENNTYLNVADSNAIALAVSKGDVLRIGTANITANVGQVFNYYETQVSMPTGTYNNIDCKQANFVQAINVTGSLTITGFTAGYEGQELIFLHPAVSITYRNQNAGSTAINQIITKTGADLTVAPNTSNAERFIYAQGYWFQI